MRLAIAAAATTLLSMAPATAFDDYGYAYGDGYFYGDPLPYGSEPQPVELRGSIGIIGLEAREHVFVGPEDPNNLSLLIWQSVAPMANVGATFWLPDAWRLDVRARAAMLGDSHMEDFDWLAPFRPGFGPDDWTHRSQHPDTNLDWYLDGSVALGLDLPVGEGAKINFNAGLAYTDVQWTAYGGDFIYSVGGFRDTAGTFGDEAGITYRQRLPVIFAGFDADVESDGWTFGATARAGFTVLASATDHHWLRDLRFEDYFVPAPVVSLGGRVGYAVSDGLDLFAEASLDKVFLGRGDTDAYDIPSGGLLGQSGDTAGTELGSAALSAGVKGRF